MADLPLLALYSAAHFWVDLSCAFLVLRTQTGAADFALCLLLYNFCAFALQMPLGLLADRLDRNGPAAAAGLRSGGAGLSGPPAAACRRHGGGGQRPVPPGRRHRRPQPQ